MLFTTDNEIEAISDAVEVPCLVLDGTVNLDYADEDQLPRVRGLVELVERYLGRRDS